MDERTDAEFLAAFRAQSIPQAAWTHRAHLRAAYLHLCETTFDHALQSMRDGIKKLNAEHGPVETPGRGYHETITRAWLTIIASTIESRGRADSFDAFIAQHPHLLSATLLRLYYSPGGMPPQARYEFIPPDLAPLPRSANAAD